MQSARSKRCAGAVIVALALSLSAARLVSAGEPSQREELSARPPAPGELALETRLIAPCCWQGTLDAHASESAQALRMQIRARLYAGEAPEQIEEALVQQYGERIRASSPRDPLRFVAVAMVAATALAGLGVWRVLRRWRRSAARRAAAPSLAPAAPDAYDARLDDELAELD
jgi:cytochrome c-type biogenesis protein CcmH